MLSHFVLTTSHQLHLTISNKRGRRDINSQTQSNSLPFNCNHFNNSKMQSSEGDDLKRGNANSKSTTGSTKTSKMTAQRRGRGAGTKNNAHASSSATRMNSNIQAASSPVARMPLCSISSGPSDGNSSGRLNRKDKSDDSTYNSSPKYEIQPPSVIETCVNDNCH